MFLRERIAIQMSATAVIEAGRLEARRVGRDHIIITASLGSIERKSPAGRPPKQAQAEKASGAGKKRGRSR